MIPGIPADQMEGFLYNIGVRTEPPPVVVPSIRGERRLWRSMSAERATSFIDGLRNVTPYSAIDWSRFQAEFNMGALEDIVVNIAESTSRNYVGVTESPAWRWTDCRRHETMIPHVERGFTTMYVLHANIGKHITMIEEHLCDVVKEECFRYRYRNENGRRYVKGPIVDHAMYVLYMVVG